MTESEELIVRERLTTLVAGAVTFDRVIPAPIYFVDKADYLATRDGGAAPTTAKAIAQSHIAFACIYLKALADDPASPPHSPTTTWTYECYLFSETDLEREDETDPDPDDFLKLTLKRHNDFVASVVNVKAAFQGEINVPDLTGYVSSETLPVTVREEIQNDTECEFVGGVRGSSMRLGLQVRLEEENC